MLNLRFQRAFALLLTLTLLFGCESLQKDASNGSVRTLPALQKSPNDDREYRAIELPNRLQVVLVSDPTIEVAAVSMAVGVGSFQDPDSQLGLAHYLEHMLFLGTEKYPEPNSFQKFVDENAGVWNAYTASDHTNYFFRLNAEKLDESLDYFSDYFKKPTFDPQYSDKERNAVNSEWSMGRSQDNRIMYFLSGQTANPQHPVSRLSVGNLETLSDKPDSVLQDELLAFYDRYYSANIMKLTMVGKQSLDELQAMAVKHFSSIPNKNVKRPQVKIPALTETEEGKIIHYKSQMDIKRLMVEFPIPDNSSEWRVKPNTYINNLITSEEPGTLGEQLRFAGLVNSVYGFVAEDYYGADGMIRVIADLTDDGLKNRDQIIAAILGYLELIKEDGIKERYYQEFKAILEKDFANMAKPDPMSQAVGLSGLQLDLPVKNLLDADYIYEKFDRRAIEKVLRQIEPQRARIWYISQGEETDTDIPFHKGSYSIRDITPAELNRWALLGSTMQFELPPENPLFSSGHNPVVDSKHSKPFQVVSQPGAEAWLTHAQHYKEDKGLIELSLNVNFAAENARASVLSSLLGQVYQLQNLSLTDRAERAGISIGLSFSASGSPVISTQGYAEKQPQLMNELVDHLADMKISERDFGQVVERYRQSLINIKKTPPYQQLFTHYERLIRENGFSLDQLETALKDIKHQDLVDWQQRYFENNLIRVYAFGNFTDAQVQEITGYAAEKFKSRNQPEQRYLLPYITPTSTTRLSVEETTEQTDSAILTGFIGTQPSLKQQAALRLLNSVLSNEFFTQLRTNEQLGYVVNSSASSFRDYPVFLFYVQSTNTALPGVNERINKFRTDFKTRLDAMTPESLEQIRRSEINLLLQKPTDFYSEAREHMADYQLARFTFDRKERFVAALESVTMADLQAVYREWILGEGAARLDVQIKGSHFAEEPFATVK